MILYDILEGPNNLDFSDIICFQPHGRSFKILDRDRFVSEVLPRFFPNQSTISSFQRQLSIYGFLRLAKPGPDQNSYYHELFLRGRPGLLDLIKRTKTKGCMVRSIYDPSTEPCFYTMSPIQNFLPTPFHKTKDNDQVPASKPAAEFHQDTTESKPTHQSQQSVQLLPVSDADTSSTNTFLQNLAHPDYDASTGTSMMAINNETATTFAAVATSRSPTTAYVSVVQNQNFDPEWMTGETIHNTRNDTPSAILPTSEDLAIFLSNRAHRDPATSTVTMASNIGQRPILAYGSAVQNQHLDPVRMTGDKIHNTGNDTPGLALTLLPTSEALAQMPQLQTAIQQYNVMLTDYNNLQIRATTTHQPVAMDRNHANDTTPYDHRASTMQEQHHGQVETGLDSAVGGNVPNSGYQHYSRHVFGHTANDRNDNVNSDSANVTHGSYEFCLDTIAVASMLELGDSNAVDDSNASDESLVEDGEY